MKKVILVVCISVVSAVLIWVGTVGYHGYQLFRLYSGAQTLEKAELAKQLPALVRETNQHVSVLRAMVKPVYPVLRVMGGLPGVGPTMAQAEPLLETAYSMLPSLEQTSMAFEPVLQDVFAAPAPDREDFVQQVLTCIGENPEVFDALVDSANSSKPYWETIDAGLFPERVQGALLAVDENYDQLLEAAAYVKLLPALAGMEETQTYLILAQNNDELRATGGFISGIGTVEVSQGDIVGFTMDDSYAVDDFSKGYPTPPEPLLHYMLSGYWVPRDANWYPDFPTSAKITADLYSLSTGVETDGVIAFDQTAVIEIMSLVGSLLVEGVDEPVTSENIEAYMWQARAPDAESGLTQEWWEHRKDFMGDLGGRIVAEIKKKNSAEEMIALAQKMEELLRRGHLSIYLDNSSGEELLKKSGWDGGLTETWQDYVGVVDSNIGFNKMDGVLQRKINYKVDLRVLSSPKARVTLTYINPVGQAVACVHEPTYGDGSYADMQKRCYWNYWRVYLPIGSELIQVDAPDVPQDVLMSRDGWTDGQIVQAVESGYEVFEGLLVLPTNASQTIILDVQLPGYVVQPYDAETLVYTVFVQKQLGVESVPYELEILLPENLEMVFSNASSLIIEGSKITLLEELHESKLFEFRFQVKE
ncbi:MAG: hypothetical protein CVU39_12380 [Chloroflexi bacterium HGW-Chloroflexi-10]|nr:MAG: hypothetical protein CVU39_12380 [Chloroflexi bacterium HGW-Chloroflexi-10]